MNNVFTPFICIFLFFVASVSTAGQEVKKYIVNIGDFKELHVDNSIAVDYYCDVDSAGKAVLFATDKQADGLLFNNNKKGKLTVLTDADYPQGESLPHVIVYSEKLTKVVNSGDSLVKAHDIPSAEKFNATLIGNGRLVVHDVHANKVEALIMSGNGQLVISGSCNESSLKVVGKGTIQADNLKAEKEKVTIVGNGTIGCNPINSLVIKGMGSGTVYYRQLPAQFRNHGMGLKHAAM